MRNAIKYYYDIDVEKIIFKNEVYIFDNFILKELKKNIDINIYNFFINNHIYIHQIIYNNRGEYVTIIDNKKYILLKKNNDVEINISSIINFFIDINVTNTKNWATLWEQKIDYYEKNMITIKDKELLEVFPYYIGLGELAIRLYNEAGKNKTYCICHDRLVSEYDFYSPDNIIADYKVRDIAEYIKIAFFNNDLTINEVFLNLNKIMLSADDYMILYARLLFPTYIFDCIESNGNCSKYISKINQFELLLNEIYNYISLKNNIPKIDWLIKKA